MANDSKILVYGTQWCGDCSRAKAFMDEKNISYNWVDIDEDADANKEVERLNNGNQVVPTIIFEDGSMLVEPSNAQLAEKLGISV